MLLAPLAIGCASSHDSASRPAKTLRDHERTFDPSKYPSNTDERKPEAPEPQTRPSEDATDEWVERSEKVMGYRIQLHSTTDMNEARSTLARLKSRLDSLSLDEGRMDLVFDAPYYKIRFGDYLTKSDADRKRDDLHGLGFPNAWVVRDNVIRIRREKR